MRSRRGTTGMAPRALAFATIGLLVAVLGPPGIDGADELRADELRAEEPGALDRAAPAFVPRDARLERAVTLDDYHPWKPIVDPERWAERARRVREQILVAAGLWPMPPAAPLDATIHGRIERDGYTVEKVFFRSHPGFYVTGNLYRPKAPADGNGALPEGPEGSGSDSKRPGVLCPHGHWSNGRFYERPEPEARREVESGAEARMEGARYPLQARAAMLARMGCVVFHYDMVGNADSRQLPHAAGFGDLEAELRLQSAFGLQTYNSIRSLDFLLSLPDVDPDRIGVTGASGGGTQTFFLAAVDDRPSVLFPAVMVSTAMQGGCVCENATLLRVSTGNIEFAALAAPRPLGMTGANDWTKEIETKGLPELRALYAALGAPDLVDAKCFPQFDHNYNQVSRERMYAWLNRHLKLGREEPIREEPFEPIPPKELSVFDDAHPRPGDAVDAAGLRRILTEISDAQMAALVPRDGPGLAEYRRIVGGALRAIVASEVPAPGRVAARAILSRGFSAGGRAATEELLALGREGTGEDVPALWLVPEGWNGKVVVIATDDERREAVGLHGGGLHGEGRAPTGFALEVLRLGAAVLAPEVFLTGRLVPADGSGKAPTDAARHSRYCGYTYGYNRTPLAQRVHDVLTAIGYAWGVMGTNAVHLVGAGDGGLWAMLAKGVAGPAVSRTVAERPPFDLADVKGVDDLRFLPGGVKYGGWGGFAALAAPDLLGLVGEGPLPAVLVAAYRAAGVEDRLRQGTGIDLATLAARLLE